VRHRHGDDGVTRSAPTLVDPAVGFEPAKGADDALFDRELGLPAGGLDFFRIEEDEGIIANPTLGYRRCIRASGVSPSALQMAATLSLTCTYSGGAEVVDLRVMFGVAGGMLGA